MNTEIINTGLRPFRFQVDWLAFTFKRPDRDPAEQVDEFLKRFPFFKDHFDHSLSYAGGNHFEYCFRFCDGILLSYDVHNQKGVNLSISGSHLGCLFDWLPFLSDSQNPLRDLLIYLDNNYCRVSRIDLAFDDFDMVYTPLDILNLKMQHRVVTPYKDSNFFFAGDEKTGYTIQFGKRCSGSHLRIYDKDKESNGEVSAIRYELELHAKTARDFCATIRENGQINMKEFFCSKFKILSDRVSEFGRKWDCPIDPVWSVFIDKKFSEFLCKDSLPKSQVSRSAEKVLSSLVRSLRTVALTIPALPLEYVQEIFDDIISRFDNKDWVRLRQNSYLLNTLLEGDIYL